MADDTEDLGFSVGADTAGLDDAERRTLAFLDRFTQTVTQATRALPALDINTAPVEGSLGRARDAFQRFIREARDLSAVPFLNTAAAKQELQELIAEFPGLNAALKHIDPTGILQRTAQQAQEATQAILAAQQAVTATPAARPVGAGGGTLRGDETQQLRLLAALTEEEERHERQLGATTRATQGLAASETQLAATMAQQAIAAVRSGAAAQVQAEAAARAQDRVNQAQRLAQAAAQTPPPPPPVPPNLDLLAHGYEGFTVKAEEARRKAEQLRETMLQQGQAARRASGDNEAAAAALGGINVQTGQIAGRTTSAAGGIKTMATSMASMAAQAVGAKSQVASLATSFLFFGVGGPVVIGLAATALAAAVAFELITRKTQEARKATEDFIDAQVKAARGQDAVGSVREAFAGVDEPERHVEGLTARLVRLNAELAKLRRGEEVPTGAGGSVLFVDDAEIAKVLQKIENLKTAAKQAGLDFLRPLIAAQLAATRQGIDDDLALQQQGVQAREQALRQGYAVGLVRTEEYYRQRRSIAEAGAANEIAALQRQLAATQTQRADTPAEVTARTAQEAHLRNLITLRQQGLVQQRDAIANEEALAKFALEAEQHALRIARAGGGNRLGGLPPELELPTPAPGREPLAPPIPPILQGALSGGQNGSQQGDEIARGFQTAAEKARLLNEGIFGIVGGLEAIGEAARSALGQVGGLLGGLNDVARANQAITDAQANNDPAAEAAASLQKTTAVLGVIGQAVGFLGSFIGGITGKSPAEQERDRTLAENNRQLAQLRTSLDRSLQGASGIARAADVARLLAVNPNIRDPQQEGILGRNDLAERNQEELARAVGAAGFSIEQFADAVKQTTGLDILDKKGQVVADTLEQADRAFRLLIQQITHLGTSLGEQQRNQNLSDTLGITGPQGPRSADPRVADLQRQRDLELSNLELSQAEEQRIRNLDLETAQGRAAFLDFQKDLFRRAAAGELTPEQLSGFQNAQDLADTVGQTIDIFKAFNTSLASEAEKISLRSRLAGQPQDAASVFDRQIMAAAAVVGDSSRDFQRQLLGLLPLEGDALREGLLKLFDSFQAEGLDLGALTPEEFFALLGSGADALDAFTQATADATKQLQGVPDFFKLGEAEFAARSIGNDGAATPVRFDGPLVNVQTRQAPASTTSLPASAPQPATLQTRIYVTGPINLVFKEPPKNAEELRRAVKSGAMRAALAETGREDDPSV